MSRAWMPIYWGDYLRDTRNLTTLQHGAYLLLIAHYWQHGQLPDDEAQLAAIAGVQVRQWRAIQAPIADKFQAGWKHKRIDAEIEQAERKINQRAIAGRAGGFKSGVARAVKRGQSIREAAGKQLLQPRLSENEANDQAGTKHSRTNHNHQEYTASEYEAAREGLAENTGIASPALAALIHGKSR